MKKYLQYKKPGVTYKPTRYYKNPWYNGLPLDYSGQPKSSDKRDIIEWLVGVHIIEWYATKRMKLPLENNDVQELIQLVWEYLYNIPQSRFDSIYSTGGKYGITAVLIVSVNRVSRIIYPKSIDYIPNIPKEVEGFWSELVYKPWRILLEPEEWEEFYDTGRLEGEGGLYYPELPSEDGWAC